MSHRFGFGEVTEVTDKGGTKKYEKGHVEVSRNAFNHAIEEYSDVPPAGAVGLALATETAGIDLAGYVGAGSEEPDLAALRDAVESIDGVGEETADQIMEAVTEAL